MTKYESRPKRLKELVLQPKSLLVGYALFDVVWTYVIISHNQTKAILEASGSGSDIDFMYSPLQATLLGPGILLLASATLWLSRPWSYLASIAASGWLLWRGMTKWEAIASAQFPEIPMWSATALKYWWMYGGAEWDFPRFILAGLIIIYATTALIRCSAYNNSLDKGPRAALK